MREKVKKRESGSGKNKRYWTGEVEYVDGGESSWEPPDSGRLIEALCGSRLGAVTPMKSPFAAVCSVCAEF